MATKGYSSYRGRAVGKTIALAVVLVVVILAAAGYLVAQNYMVYDDDGTAHLELPFAKKEEETPALSPDEVTLDIKEPEELLREVPCLQAAQLSGSALAEDTPAEILKNYTGDLVIPVKLINGGITFDIAADIPQQVGREKEDSLETLKTILSAERYTVAHMCCLCDSYFVRAYPDAAFSLKTGSYWYDSDGWTWLNPANEETVKYLSTLCKELVNLGFDEILLDYFSYPIIGNVQAIGNMGTQDHMEALQTLAETLRSELPEDVNLSVVLRSEVSSELGLSYDMLTTCFDRIYVTPDADRSALEAQLPEGYDVANRIVTMGDTAENTGSYVILYRKSASITQTPAT